MSIRDVQFAPTVFANHVCTIGLSLSYSSWLWGSDVVRGEQTNWWTCLYLIYCANQHGLWPAAPVPPQLSSIYWRSYATESQVMVGLIPFSEHYFVLLDLLFTYLHGLKHNMTGHQISAPQHILRRDLWSNGSQSIDKYCILPIGIFSEFAVKFDM